MLTTPPTHPFLPRPRACYVSRNGLWPRLDADCHPGWAADSADTAGSTERAARTSVESQLDDGAWSRRMVRADQPDTVRRTDRRHSATYFDDTDESRRPDHISHSESETDGTHFVSVGSHVTSAVFVDVIA